MTLKTFVCTNEALAGRVALARPTSAMARRLGVEWIALIGRNLFGVFDADEAIEGVGSKLGMNFQ